MVGARLFHNRQCREAEPTLIFDVIEVLNRARQAYVGWRALPLSVLNPVLRPEKIASYQERFQSRRDHEEIGVYRA